MAKQFVYICEKCGTMMQPCEKRNCNRPGYKSVYGPGYLALVCREHYEQATMAEVRDAKRFRYAE